MFWTKVSLIELYVTTRVNGEDEAHMALQTLVTYHITTRCHNSDDRDMNPHRRENLKVSEVCN
jgi:hypothetical protein